TAPTPVLPLATPKPKNNNFLIVLLSVLLLLATSLAGFFAIQNQKLVKQLASMQVQSTPSPVPTATPDETANLSRDEVLRDWKTYTYDTFLIKLPSGWYTTQLKNPIQFLNYTPPSIGGDFDPLTDKGKLKIEVYKNKSSLSLREHVDSQKTGPLELGPYSETPIKIDGIEAVKVTTSNHGFSYYFKGSDFIYSLVFGLDFNNYTNLADQILSTFRFTK
ncbi:MAG: hypothetical protein ABIJ85_04915, partial [bacterium]